MEEAKRRFEQMDTFPRRWTLYKKNIEVYKIVSGQKKGKDALPNSAVQRNQYIKVQDHIFHIYKDLLVPVARQHIWRLLVLVARCSHCKQTSSVFKWNARRLLCSRMSKRTNERCVQSIQGLICLLCDAFRTFRDFPHLLRWVLPSSLQIEASVNYVFEAFHLIYLLFVKFLAVRCKISKWATLNPEFNQGTTKFRDITLSISF